ncbi:MAG TPA: thrombospondin type 3 repeat-containing protein [Pyrinomonadaceae bacterium]|nr:thrombospondin type 3 repeat-containing protein [Pyrinomonadaceae bacterium]
MKRSSSQLALSRALFALLLLAALFTEGRAAQSEINGPAGSGDFGSYVEVLPNGNIVVADPAYDEGALTDVGAVYLYDGATLAPISVLKGGTAFDRVGSGKIIVLANGNFVVPSVDWDNGAAQGAGAVTFCSATTGCNGVVSAANSLVGSSSNDAVGSVTALPNDHYVVSSSQWDAVAPLFKSNAGAVTHCDGTTGCKGTINASNSLVGAGAEQRIGSDGIVVLKDGDYVVKSSHWSAGTFTDAGAVTFCKATTGCKGEVSASNSLVGENSNDRIGKIHGPAPSVVELANGNYVVASSFYLSNPASSSQSRGAVTLCSGNTGCKGTVNANTSLLGGNDHSVGSIGVTALPNGNYVVSSPTWDGAAFNAGAVTFCNGTTGCGASVSAANSLVGKKDSDHVGGMDAPHPTNLFIPIVVLADGNYVVVSPRWDNGTKTDAGAVTWCSAATGCHGEVGASNSLVGTTAHDRVGITDDFQMGTHALPNGNYVVTSGVWDDTTHGIVDAGAVTYCNGAANSCANNVISQANSLVGANVNDRLGSNGTTVLANGNYVVFSDAWSNGATTNVGAVTLCNGATGCAGEVNASNSLVGSRAFDFVTGKIYALPGGDYVVVNRALDAAGVGDAGAVTHCDGTTGCTGTISASNSLVGSKVSDLIGSGGVTILPNGNYLINSPKWDSGFFDTDLGAVTFCKGTVGCKGLISASNSLVGTTPNDQVGSNTTGLPNGNYLVRTEAWNNGGTLDAGAVTFGDGTKGTFGTINSSNSILGTAANNGGVVRFTHDPVRNRYVVRRVKNIVIIVAFETTAVADGQLDNASTWSNGIPDPLTNAIIPAGRTVTVNNAATIGGLSVAGGASLVMNANLRLTGSLSLGTQINTGAHTISLGCTSAATGAPAGYVVGDVEKQFCAPVAFTYPTGTTSGASPVGVTVTSLGVMPSSLTVRTNQGQHAGMNAAHSLGRYWTLAETGNLTANLSFNYPEADVSGFDVTYQLYRWNGATETLVPSLLDTAGNTIYANGVADFGDWTVGNSASAPPPADSDGDGLPDLADNCPTTANANQADADADAEGDACDPDDDNDGQSDVDELACGSNPLDAGSKAADLDGDNSPDCVDLDDDGDGERDSTDNCPVVPNPDQSDFDGDGTGDACDPSPHGESQIVFTSNRDGNNEIYGMKADGTGVIRLTNNAADERDPTLSPDGSKIVFTSNRSGSYEIYSMNVGGTSLTRLTNHEAIDEHPSVSVKGGKIVFASNRSGDFEIYSMNFDGTGLACLTNDPGTDKHPVWSPDGSQIAFMSDRSGNFEIYTMDADGAAPVRLTNHVREDASPTWSPDGSRLAFSSKRDGNSEIYSMNADGTDLMRLTANTVSDGEPSWGANGKIAFTSNRAGNFEVYSMSAGGSGVLRLTINPAQDTSPHWPATGGGGDDPPSM